MRTSILVWGGSVRRKAEPTGAGCQLGHPRVTSGVTLWDSFKSVVWRSAGPSPWLPQKHPGGPEEVTRQGARWRTGEEVSRVGGPEAPAVCGGRSGHLLSLGSSVLSAARSQGRLGARDGTVPRVLENSPRVTVRGGPQQEARRQAPYTQAWEPVPTVGPVSLQPRQAPGSHTRSLPPRAWLSTAH